MSKKVEKVKVLTPQETVAEMAMEFLYCRTEAHSKDEIRDEDVVVNTKGYVIEFTRKVHCARCGLVKSQKFSVPDFQPVGSPKSGYPKGYLARPGTGRINRAVVRREQLVRAGFKVAK